MSYARAKDCWNGLQTYNLSGKKSCVNIVEDYTPPVTMPLWQWQEYVSAGNNVLLGSGGVIPSGTVQTPFGGGGAVYQGHVRQGYNV